MSDKVFVDSNLFIYTLDKHDKRRRTLTKKLLAELSDTNRIVISTQVLNEVFAVATRKLGIEPIAAKEFIRGLLDFDVILVTPTIIERAIDYSVLSRINYWDALMIAAADEAKCDILWTEDMASGSTIQGITIFNPLSPTTG